MNKLEVRVELPDGVLSDSKEKVTQGDFIDFDRIRVAMSNGMQLDLYNSGLKTAVYSAKSVDVIAAFTTFFPNIVEKLEVPHMKDLDPADFVPFMVAYDKYISPWLQEYNEIISQIKEK